MRDIKPGEFIIKYGVKIAVATQDIPKEMCIRDRKIDRAQTTKLARYHTKATIPLEVIWL